MKKIGILTLHSANNFGALLQNYALQQAIINIGYSPETINYSMPSLEKNYRLLSFYLTKHPFAFLKRKYWEIKNLKYGLISRNKFSLFRKQFLSISEKMYTAANIIESNYDLYIVGSDQVWSEGIIGKENVDIFNLSFTNKRKASYAASCGSLTDLIKDRTPLTAFDYVTVRENDLNDFLISEGIASRVVCDPTMLLNKKQWLDLFQERKKEEYVYLYYIDSGKNEAAKIANHIAAEKKIAVRYPKKYDKDSVDNHYGVNAYYEGPIDFIQSIYEADKVVVSSFHGVVFSVLFEKDFITILHRNTGARVANLLKKLGLEDRIVENYEDFCSKSFDPIDYSRVNPLVERWREESLAELMKICEL